MTVSFKHHWVKFFYQWSKSRLACKVHVPANSVCMWAAKRCWTTGNTSYANPLSIGWSLLFLKLSGGGGVACHNSTAVRTWTLAWPDHPSLWCLRPHLLKVCCTLCAHRISGLSGECLPSWSPTLSLSPSCSVTTGKEVSVQIGRKLRVQGFQMIVIILVVTVEMKILFLPCMYVCFYGIFCHD